MTEAACSFSAQESVASIGPRSSPARAACRSLLSRTTCYRLVAVTFRAWEPASWALKLDHRKVFLADIAFRATPVVGDVGPARAGRDAVLGPARGFVVDPAADDADPLLELGFGGYGGVGLRSRRRGVGGPLVGGPSRLNTSGASVPCVACDKCDCSRSSNACASSRVRSTQYGSPAPSLRRCGENWISTDVPFLYMRGRKRS